MSRRARGGLWLAAVVGALSGCGGDAGWAPWMFVDSGGVDDAVVVADAPANDVVDAGDVTDAGDAGARDADGGDASDGGDVSDGDDATALDVTLTFDAEADATSDVGVAQDAGFDAGGTADLGVAMDAGVDVPVDRGQPMDAGVDVPVDRGQPLDAGVDVPIDRGQPVDAGVDVPIDRGQPVDAGVDVPVDRGQPVDTGVDVPIDRGPADTGVDVPIDRGPADTGVDVPVDRGPTDTGVDVPVDVGSTADTGGVPAPDPVSYSGTFAARTGRFTANLTVQGERRTVVLVVPTSAGANPPLLLLFHGTNGDGAGVMTEANAQALANSAGVIVAAPSSRWIGHGDWDHATEETYWETAPNTDVNNNQDILLTRAIMVEAQRVYGVDPARIYAMGHSNGAFFAQFIAVLLRDRIAAFSENSGGLVRCGRTTGCTFRGSGATCAVLATRSGYCNCTGAELAVPVPTSGRMPPGLLTHGTDDPLVSVYYTCTLAQRMTANGHYQETQLFNGEGHAIPSNWAQLVWPFLSTRRLY